LELLIKKGKKDTKLKKYLLKDTNPRKVSFSLLIVFSLIANYLSLSLSQIKKYLIIWGLVSDTKERYDTQKKANGGVFFD